MPIVFLLSCPRRRTSHLAEGLCSLLSQWALFFIGYQFPSCSFKVFSSFWWIPAYIICLAWIYDVFEIGCGFLLLWLVCCVVGNWVLVLCSVWWYLRVVEFGSSLFVYDFQFKYYYHRFPLVSIYYFKLCFLCLILTSHFFLNGPVFQNHGDVFVWKWSPLCQIRNLSHLLKLFPPFLLSIACTIFIWFR